jgi:hypothetical protein
MKIKMFVAPEIPARKITRWIALTALFPDRIEAATPRAGKVVVKNVT